MNEEMDWITHSQNTFCCILTVITSAAISQNKKCVHWVIRPRGERARNQNNKRGGSWSSNSAISVDMSVSKSHSAQSLLFAAFISDWWQQLYFCLCSLTVLHMLYMFSCSSLVSLCCDFFPIFFVVFVRRENLLSFEMCQLLNTVVCAAELHSIFTPSASIDNGNLWAKKKKWTAVRLEQNSERLLEWEKVLSSIRALPIN